jgi:hypothetical protein
VLSAAGLVVLVIAARETGSLLALAAASIYGVSLVFCYVSSALYHSVTQPGWKRFFLLLDHSAIYMLIAGTYTRSRSCAASRMVAGLVHLDAGPDRHSRKDRRLSAWSTGPEPPHVSLDLPRHGVDGAGPGWEIFEHLPGPGLAWLVAGGVVYSLVRPSSSPSTSASTMRYGM